MKTRKTFINARCCYCNKINKVICHGRMDAEVGDEHLCPRCFTIDFKCFKCNKKNKIIISLKTEKNEKRSTKRNK